MTIVDVRIGNMNPMHLRVQHYNTSVILQSCHVGGDINMSLVTPNCGNAFLSF